MLYKLAICKNSEDLEARNTSQKENSIFSFTESVGPGSVEQSIASRARLKSQRSQVQYPVRPHIFVSPSADSRRAVVSYWRKYV